MDLCFPFEVIITGRLGELEACLMGINSFNNVSLLTVMIYPAIVELHSSDMNFVFTLSYSHLLLDSNRVHVLKS